MSLYTWQFSFKGKQSCAASVEEKYECHVWNRVPIAFNVSGSPEVTFAILPLPAAPEMEFR